MSKTGEKWVASISPDSVSPSQSSETKQTSDSSAISSETSERSNDQKQIPTSQYPFYDNNTVKQFLGKTPAKAVAVLGIPWKDDVDDDLGIRWMYFEIVYKSEFAIDGKRQTLCLIFHPSGSDRGWVCESFTII
jgi:hypothetical protein